MDLTKILAISGKPGLYKVLGQTQNNGIIVESLLDGKRFPAYAANKISSLEDISIYTSDEDVPLKVIFKSIYDKENGKQTLSTNEDISKLRTYFKEILPNYDEERVYNSDIKKVFKWYNELFDAGIIDQLKEESKPEEKATEPTSEKESKKEKASTTKKTAVKKAAPVKQKATKQAPKTAPMRTTSKKG